MIMLITLIVFGIGLGIFLSKREQSSLTRGAFWRPAAGTRWQIVLNRSLIDQDLDVPVFDIDLFSNNAKIITSLHAADRKVICYFSAGSYEPFRPDTKNFHPSDRGGQLDEWPGEYWLDTNSRNVRNIMKNRLKLAAQIGCDGVDPDNIDAYDNANGFGLTIADAINFLKFLATEAHSHNLSIGLKNGGKLVPDVLDFMQWDVNEQCLQFDECDMFQPFVKAGKPVFHIEYPDTLLTNDLILNKYCEDKKTRGFSTVLKKIQLDEWAVNC
ncbi:putative endo alpha-1,4 polygalactosaminidase [Golovinomyces cichoracearum]|uniref:alpha-galactosidase n=1 Tax=Golovinomyces cichoracearum TaxID=62708 RepID=A0A420J242_9PEZI|nr:putative endo alpha-1,4 polygalactosaminidase [Golovinomyces cichoracearum]